MLIPIALGLDWSERVPGAAPATLSGAGAAVGALVVEGAAVSEYAQIDSHGRYRIKFLFDESDLSGGKASTWVRMLQPHGGGIEGFHFPLRAGVEVMCAFEGGDPDRPAIVVPQPIMRRGFASVVAVPVWSGSKRPLPAQRRFSEGGPGTLPGYDFRADADGALSCGSTQVVGLPAQCDRVLLLQAEYRSDLQLRSLVGEDAWGAMRWRPRAEWVLFADAGNTFLARWTFNQTVMLVS